MDYMTAKDKAAEWNISLRRVQMFCEQDRIEGVLRLGKVWVIPKNAKRPSDRRYTANKPRPHTLDCSLADTNES